MRHMKLAAVLFASIFVSGQCFAQQNLHTISGKVVSMDAEGNVVTVSNDAQQVMVYITPESELKHLTQDMASIEIEIGDPVTVDYINEGDKDVVASLIDKKPIPKNVLQKSGD